MTSYGAASFTYTAHGELLARVDPEGTTGFDYDVLGNLRSVSLPDGTGIEYLVDARHRRIGRKVDGTLERGWLWASQLAPAAELDGTGQVVSRFVHATRVNVPDLILRDGATYRLLTDPLGGPRLAIDTATGAVVQRMDYDEWGVVLLDTNPGWQPFGFGGGLYDADTELVRFGWRDYDPVAGRWASKDPIIFGGGDTNLFTYSAGDPNNLVDPSGLWALYCELAGNAAWGLGGPGVAGSVGIGFDGKGNVFFFTTGGFGVGSGAGVSPSFGLSGAPTGRDLAGPGGMLTVGTPWLGGSLGRSGPAGEQAPVYWAAELSPPSPNVSTFSGVTQTTVSAFSVRDAVDGFVREVGEFLRDLLDYSLPYPTRGPDDSGEEGCGGCL